MSANATNINVHLNIDGASILYFSMVCCIILITIVVIIMCIFLGALIYIVIDSKKSRQSLEDRPLRKVTKERGNQSRNINENSSSFNAVGTPASSVQEFDPSAEPNAQSIPLSTFRRHTVNDRLGDSSESSAELYEVLFPGKHGGESIYNPPQLVTFAGQVYVEPSAESSSQTNFISGPSTSRANCDGGSLEWDNFPQENLTNTEQDEFDEETQQSTAISWV